MSEKLFSTEIGTDAIMAQYEEESKRNLPQKKKVNYDPKHYLDTIMKKGELEKSLTIRLLPFSKTEPLPFHKIYMHSVRVNKEFAASGWKLLVCPKHNGFSDQCPFCQLQERTRDMMFAEKDENKRKQMSNIEFANRAREFWVVRCIDRDKEEDGVKFWTFPHSRKNDGIYDKIMNIFNKRKLEAEKRGREMNIFSLENGKDLEITIKKDANNKSVYTIIDCGEATPLTEDVELGNSWINDPVEWTDVYSAKPYDYLELVLQMKVPIFDKESGHYVAKDSYTDYMQKKLEKQSQASEEFDWNKPQELREIEQESSNFDTNAQNQEMIEDIPF